MRIAGSLLEPVPWTVRSPSHIDWIHIVPFSMPGIAGILNRGTLLRAPEAVETMVRSMLHEPRYVYGIVDQPELGVCVGWIGDVDQPTLSRVTRNEDDSIVLVLSGECFPAEGFVLQLRARGHTIGPESQDWIVHAYEELGPSLFSLLNGLFSGVLMDLRRRTVYLFNDRYRVDRLYTLESSGVVYFASEAKALLAVVPESKGFDMEGVAQFVSFGCTIGDRTLFRDIRVLPGASLWTLSDTGLRKSTYFSQEEWEQQASMGEKEFLEQLSDLLARIVPKYANGLPMLGVSLTGGLDTRMLMACLPEAPERMVAFTYSGEDCDPLDAKIAAVVASASGLKHHCLRIGPDFFTNFETWADRTVYVTDGCAGVTGAHEIYMSQVARGLAPVRITGNYGGELLRGVSTFKPSVGLAHDYCPELRDQVKAIVADWHAKRPHPISFAAFEEIGSNLIGNLIAGRSQIGFRTPYLDNEFVRLAYRGLEVAQSSFEICTGVVRSRSPRLAAIPTDMGYLGNSPRLVSWTRNTLARIAFKLDYMNNEGFPAALAPLEPVFRRTLHGLGLLGLHKHLHYRNWFQAKLFHFIADRLEQAANNTLPFFDQRMIRRLAIDHRASRGNRVVEIGTVLTLHAVAQLLLSSGSPIRPNHGQPVP